MACVHRYSKHLPICFISFSPENVLWLSLPGLTCSRSPELELCGAALLEVLEGPIAMLDSGSLSRPSELLVPSIDAIFGTVNEGVANGLGLAVSSTPKLQPVWYKQMTINQ